MGKCFSAPKKDQSRDVTLSIFGLDNAGKSSVIKVLQGGSHSEVAPTVGFATNHFKWKRTSVTVLDVGGGSRIRDIWKNYFAESHGLVFVVDASDRDRIGEAGEVFSKLLSDQRIQGKPVLLLLNKKDLVGAINDTQATEQMHLEPLVNSNKCHCRVDSVSATLGTGKHMDSALNEGFNWLIGYITDHYQELSNKVNRDMEVQRAQLAKEKEERMERIRKAKEEREALGEVDEDEELEEKARVDGPHAHIQNGHANHAQGLNDAASQTSRTPSISNGHLPSLVDLGNRQKRRIRPSSSGEEAATLTSSYQASVIPHLPPIISPPHLRRPLPRLPTSDEIPPPATPPPEVLTEIPLSPKPPSLLSPSFHSPPSFSDIGTMANQNDQQNSEESVVISDQAARRKRRKKRLQRFNNQTVPVNDTSRNGGDTRMTSAASPNLTPSVLKPELARNRLPSLDPTVSNGSSLSVPGAETSPKSHQPLANATVSVPE